MLPNEEMNSIELLNRNENEMKYAIEFSAFKGIERDEKLLKGA